jgi:TetR/AcrR family transcriptional regulator, lmrAB and yxaGH operons repressor
MQVRDRLIAATARLMACHGVAGTGIAEILTASGVTRRSIYLNFPGGKSELVAASTRAAGEEIAASLRAHLSEPDPIAAFTTMWRQVLVDTDFEGGCPVLAAACSRDEAPEAAAAAADAYATWAQMLTERLVTDGIKTSVAQSLSTTIVAAFEGAVVLSRATRSTDPLDSVAQHMSALVASHRRRPARKPSR